MFDKLSSWGWPAVMQVGEGEDELCDKNALCLFHPANNT